MIINLKTTPVIYINLERDYEKNERMQKLTEDYGFDDVTRFNAYLNLNNGPLGCTTSHMRLLETIPTPTIVLEDDCFVRRNVEYIEVPDDADAVYLGLSAWGMKNDNSGLWNHSYEKTDIPNVFKINNMLATHAILYLTDDFRNACLRVAQWSYKNKAEGITKIDCGYADIMKYYSVYALGDPIFYQTSAERSTNITFGSIKLRRFT